MSFYFNTVTATVRADGLRLLSSGEDLLEVGQDCSRDTDVDCKVGSHQLRSSVVAFLQSGWLGIGCSRRWKGWSLNHSGCWQQAQELALSGGWYVSTVQYRVVSS